MARTFCSCETGAVSYAANTTKTLIGILAPTNQAIAIQRIAVSFEGVAAADKPVRIEWGTFTGETASDSTAERVVQSPGTAPTIQSAVKITFTNDGTFTAAGAIYCHLQSGYERVFQRGQDEVAIAPGIKWGIRVTNPTGNSTTNAIGTIEWEE